MTDQIRLDPPSELTMELGEAMFTQRAIRRLDPDRPIDDEQLKLILDAASKAPNGGNAQPGRFFVIRDRSLISAFGELYHEAWWAKRADQFGWKQDHQIPDDSPYRMAALLADEIGQAPAVVLAFSLGKLPGDSSVFPGVQNLMLAARALGIGSTLTTLHPTVMERVHELLAIPDGVAFHCCVPLGYPRGNFGTTERLPTAETTSWNTWATPPPWV
ncbi:MAG: nitroreductase family protein [Acidimicrobiales bacterium]